MGASDEGHAACMNVHKITQHQITHSTCFNVCEYSECAFKSNKASLQIFLYNVKRLTFCGPLFDEKTEN